MTPTPLDELRAALDAATSDLREGREAPGGAPTLERPPRADFGDYSTNAAMLHAPGLGRPPRELAEALGPRLEEQLGAQLDRWVVAGPGFLNLFLSDAWYGRALEHVLSAGEGYGGGCAGTATEKVLVEFVSANPTGPLTAASARHAAYGDALSRLLEFAGHAVEREYYVNDHGTQVRRLGESILARARGAQIPEGGYEGDYVRAIAERIDGARDLDPDTLAQRGVELMLPSIERTLESFGVHFDRFFSERSLHEGSPSAVDRAYEHLREGGHLYESEGALWLRSTALGDDKDRVLRRSSGEPTYYTSDIAYHDDKLARGHDRVIDVLGADHHGYVGRMRAAFAALGADPGRLEILIMQFVNVLERGERAKMSKRRGDFVTFDDLLADIGADAARFFLLLRSHDSMVDIDLDLAREQSRKNPVYYVQYAHARIASVREKATFASDPAAEREQPYSPEERALLKLLLAFPAEIREATAARAPHRVAAYALELAQSFTQFYEACPVLKEGTAPGLAASRLALCEATQRVIARGLNLLGVSAPQSM